MDVLAVCMTSDGCDAGMLLISEWWASETAVMMAGLLPDPERDLSAMSVYQLSNAMCFMLPLGLAVAVGTRCASEVAFMPSSKLQ